MNHDTYLSDLITRITRNDIKDATCKMLDVGGLLGSLDLARVNKVGTFWISADGEERRQLLLKHTQDLLSGFRETGVPLVYAICQENNEKSVLYGVPSGSDNVLSLSSTLRGAYPDVRLTRHSADSLGIISNLTRGVRLIGVPSTEVAERCDYIDKVLRGAGGAPWCYVVYSQAVERRYIEDIIQQQMTYIHDIYATYMLKMSATDEHNRTAKKCVDLIESSIKRFESGLSQGMWQSGIYFLTDDRRTLAQVSGLLQSAFIPDDRLQIPIRIIECHDNVGNSTDDIFLNSKELAQFINPPYEDYNGYETIDYTRFGVTAKPCRDGEDGLLIGSILHQDTVTADSICIARNDLVRHALVVGMTGSGKTNTCISLIEQVWNRGRGVPFLVIESAKSEYRRLVSSPQFEGLNIFTPGNETLAPFRLNPFEVPDGILVQSHIDYLKSLFAAAFVLYPPMPYVLEQSLGEIYEDKGWDLVRNVNERGGASVYSFPTLGDLAEKIPDVIERLGYDERLTMDITAGLSARINQLRMGGGKGIMLDCRRSIDLHGLFRQPALIELKHIVNDEEKAFIIGLILIRLYEYFEISGLNNDNKLVHLSVIEEAHRLLRNVSIEQTSEVTPNPQGKAVEVFANILSEIRAFGEGLVIAEQIPTKLAPDVIKNTNLKVIHRLVSKDDRELARGSMILDDNQANHCSRLSVGHAVVSCEHLNKPTLVSVPPVQNSYSDVTDEDIRLRSRQYWQSGRVALHRYAACTSCRHYNAATYCRWGIGTVRDESVEMSFVRLFNTMRLNKARLDDALYDFEYSLQRDEQRTGQSEIGFCVFSGLLEAHLLRSGAFFHWPYAEIEALLTKGTEVAVELFQTRDEETSAPMIRDFAYRLKNLYASKKLPFEGCFLCQRPCSYLFDMSQLPGRADEEEFTGIFLDSAYTNEDILKTSISIARQWYFHKDKVSTRNAAYCYTVAQLSKLNVLRVNQKRLGEQLFKTLSNYSF